MDAIESFIASVLIKALHKSAPTMTPDDDAKVTQAVINLVNAGMDVAAIYFVLRDAKK